MKMYHFGSGMLRSAKAGFVTGEVWQDLLNCWLGRSVPTESIKIDILPGGRMMFDVFWVSIVPIVSSRIVDLMRRHDLSGWATYPVRLVDHRGAEVPDYCGLRITGRCSTIELDKAHSELVFEKRPHGLFPHYRGLYVDTATWDGSDMFAAQKSSAAWVVATQKVKEAFEREQIHDVEFRLTSDIQVLATDQEPVLSSNPLH